MKKFLLAASLLFTCLTGAFAQVTWEKGQEISEEVGMGNLNFESNPCDYWKFTSSTGPTSTGGLFEVYDGTDADLWQVVKLPAGMYRFECQGYYRHGTSWDQDPNSYGTADWEDLAVIYAQGGSYNIESEEFAASGRNFKTPLMPRLFDSNSSQIYEDTVKEGWDMSDGDYGAKGWGPCSIPGTLLWFAAGKYMPYVDADDETIKYNTVSFFVANDSYVKLGIKKTEKVGADSFLATNFHLYYEGEVDAESAELALAQGEVEELLEKVEKYQIKYADEGALMYVMCDEFIMDFQDEYGDVGDMSTDECKLAAQAISEFIAELEAAIPAHDLLASSIKSINILCEKTDYDGKEAFASVVDEANSLLDPNAEIEAEDLDFGRFEKAYNALAEARIKYLMSDSNKTEDANGVASYNFSALIKNPFFCNEEYTPVMDPERGYYVYQNVETEEGGEFNIEETWVTKREQSTKDIVSENPDWIDIASDVTIYEKELENVWLINPTTTWHDGNTNHITMQHGYTAVGGWTASPSGNPEFLRQTITNLPNGYYSMSALMLDAGTMSENMYAYIENTNGDRKVAPHSKAGTTFWWDGEMNWRAYIANPDAENGCWDMLKTDMIKITDGKVTIGTASDSFYASTGFQLYYYGEELDFSALIKKEINNLNDKTLEVVLAGDVKHIEEELAKIPTTINTAEEFDAAKADLKVIADYADQSIKTMKNWTDANNGTPAKFSKLADMCEEGSDKKTIVEVAALSVVDVPDGETVTYSDLEEVAKSYNSYIDYLTTYDKVIPYATDGSELKSTLSSQLDELANELGTPAQITEYIQALNSPYNDALFDALKCGDATLESPVDVTTLIVNPNIEGSTGWEAENITFDNNWKIAESYNTGAFKVKQTLYSLPAGTYELKVQSFYRDNGSANGSFMNLHYNDTYTPNVKLFAADVEEDVVSIASELFTETAMPTRNSNIVDDIATESWLEEHLGMDDYDVNHKEYFELTYGQEKVKLENGELVPDLNSEGNPQYETGYPWDDIVPDDQDYWYPNSIEGTSKRFAASPEAYVNTITFHLDEKGDVTFGLKKNTGIGNDWCMFDNWKLFYLGTEIPVGVENVNSDSKVAAGIYSVSGAKINAMQKGLNIVKMADGSVKKVMVK